MNRAVGGGAACGALLTVFEMLDGQAGGPSSMGGWLKSDGSAVPHIITELSLAGWAVIELGDDGAVLARFYGPVEAPLPQALGRPLDHRLAPRGC